MNVLEIFGLDHLLKFDQVGDYVPRFQGDSTKSLGEKISASSSWFQGVSDAIEIFIASSFALNLHLAKWYSSVGDLESFISQQFLVDVLSVLDYAVFVVEDLVGV